jgi:ABC-2 type transport system ATP-binding protein
MLGADHLDVIVAHPADLTKAVEIVRGATGSEPETDQDNRKISAPTRDRVGALTEAVRALHDAGIEVADLTLRRPTLDEAFLHITTHVSESEGAVDAWTAEQRRAASRQASGPSSAQGKAST